MTTAFKCFVLLLTSLFSFAAAADDKMPLFGGVPQSIVVRASENITEGGWVWILNKAREHHISRIYLLVKQDENGFLSKRTQRTLRSGELFVRLPGEATSEGWDNSDWLVEMLAKAKASGIEVFAWWPLFNDDIAAKTFLDAAYAGPGGEAFVDPAFPGVKERQEVLIDKLLATYPFDGVIFDWIRYNGRADGAKGPLGERFRTLTGVTWSEEAMKTPALRASWDDLRASEIASWARDFVALQRRQHAHVKWGAFVLPWQFKEVAQSYRHLGDAGLDDLQPMIYWADWSEGPDFTGDVLVDGVFRLRGTTQFRPTFDLNVPAAETLKALGDLSPARLGGVTWYWHQDWSEPAFARIGEIAASWEKAGAPVMVGNDDAGLDPAPPPAKRMGQRLAPFPFAPDASVWAVVCLAELYKRKALDDVAPSIPVLALHRFAKADVEKSPNLWFNSSAYVEQLMAFIKAAGFSVVPLSSVEAYMLSEDPTIIPKRPLAITIDDGSLSIAQQFHPLAKAIGFPYSVALITSLVKDDAQRGSLEDYGIQDPILSPAEVRKLAESGLVEFSSHTHDLHRWVPEDEEGQETRPAMTARQWLTERGRKETYGEWRQRISQDLVRSRLALTQMGAKGPATLTWPYGDRNGDATKVARDAGFAGFLDFGNSAFAYPSVSVRDIARVAVTRADEAVPLAMPRESIEQQRWWLSFLKWARATKSADLVEAALEQLEGEQKAHPEAEVTRAALEALRGHTGAALARLNALRKAYPHDSLVHTAIDDLVEDYAQVL